MICQLTHELLVRHTPESTGASVKVIEMPQEVSTMPHHQHVMPRQALTYGRMLAQSGGLADLGWGRWDKRVAVQER